LIICYLSSYQNFILDGCYGHLLRHAT